jgi:hypothetical protein
MGLLDSLKSLFFGGETRPPPARRLDGRSKVLLSASLERLPIEEPGWITMQEANALFSPMETAYAFGEMDEVGKANLAAFAAAARRCHFEFMPVEGRLYFMQKANTNARADEA